MFDISLPDVADLAGADDASVVAAIGVCARAEAAVAARRLAAIAELVSRRARYSSQVADTEHWACDNWDAITAEVGAAQRISHPMASGQMYVAVALSSRLPKVGAMLEQGLISARLASAIVWHTDLITDPAIVNLVDAALAADAARFGPLSVTKTAAAIAAIVARHDPSAVRRTRAEASDREVKITGGDRGSGTAALWGRLFASDAAVLERRLTAMAAGVCEHDSRTTAQRRADALGALAAGGAHLACGCGRPECPAPAGDARAAAVVIHVVAEPATLEAPHDPRARGDGPTPEPTPTREPARPVLPGFLTGGATVPAPLLAHLAATGAGVRRLHHPAEAPEPGYRPSAALARFIRARDMTCRFPGCDNPVTDIDHTIPWPLGPTHPSNLALLCRKHHLIKTFWAGWRERQYPDGTLEWTSPTGHTYTTHPGARLIFNALCLPTGDLPTPAPDPAPGGGARRGVAMPARRRTRAQDRAQRLKSERDHNTHRISAREAQAETAPDAALAAGRQRARAEEPDFGDPPPF
jgi:hypothetical protein